MGTNCQSRSQGHSERGKSPGTGWLLRSRIVLFEYINAITEYAKYFSKMTDTSKCLEKRVKDVMQRLSKALNVGNFFPRRHTVLNKSTRSVTNDVST